MNKLFKRIVLLLVAISCLSSLSAFETKIVETQHFKIIYDERTENAAKEVYSFAEKAYSQLVALFREDPFLFMPVYIEPEERDYNAYFTSFPYNRIVIYDAPVSPSLDNTENTLYMTFIHELTHAFTFSYKDGVGNVFTSIFGDWANISVNLHMLLFMQEGISVYTESRDGGGRLNDPFFYTPLIQAKLEGKNISYMDASGGRDIMPGGNMWYVYGGAFTKWMEKRYGERDLAEYYLKIGKKLFSFPQNGYSSIFSNRLWNDWERFFSEIKVPQIYSQPDIITQESRGYSNLVINNGSLFALSSSKEALVKVEEKEERVFSYYSSYTNLSVNDKGEFLLPYVSEKESYVSLYDGNGKRIKKYDGYFDAAFLDSFLVLASSIDRITYLTIINDKEEREEIVLGRDVTLHEFTSSEDGVFFLMTRKGEERIAFLDKELELYVIDTPSNLYFSSLSTDSSILSFSWMDKNKEGEMPRYGEIDTKSMSLFLSDIDFNGGVYYPVRDKENVYFVSLFFDHSAISECDYKRMEVRERGKLEMNRFKAYEDEYSSLDLASISSPYQPLSTMKKGALIPIALNTSSFYSPSQSFGLSWITEDATENCYLLSSFGYVPQTDSLSFGTSFTISNLSFSFSGDLNASFFNWEGDVGATFTFPLSHSGEVIGIEDVMGWVSINKNGFFNNRFLFTYENTRQHGIGRFHTLGWGIKTEALNLSPSLTLFASFPGIFPYNPLSPLDYAVPFTLEGRVDLQGIGISSNFHLLTYEIQKSVRFLSLYLTYLDLYTKSDINWNYQGAVNSHHSLGLSLTLSPVLGQMSRFQVEIGAELNYNRGDGFRVKLVLGAS